MLSSCSEELKKIINGSKKEMFLLKHSYIGTEHFVLSILKSNNSIKSILNKNGITYAIFKNNIIEKIGVGNEDTSLFVFTPLFKKIMEDSIFFSMEEKNECVSLSLVFKMMLDEGEGVAFRIFCDLGIDIDSIYDSLSVNINKINSNSLLFELGVCLNEIKLDPVIGRDKEINNVIEILLRKNKCNPILVGDAGVGKTAIVEGLAKRINDGKVPKKLLNKKIISISIANLVSGTKYRGEFEEKLLKIIKEIEKNRNYIIFIDEIHTIVGAGGAEGAIDASNILKPALARGSITIIGATTIDEYKKYIEEDKALSRRLQKVMVKEPKENDLMDILKKLKPVYEEYHNVIINDSILKYIVKVSKKYITNRYEPDRSIDILDEVASLVSTKISDEEINNNELKNKLLKIKNKKQNYLNIGDYENAIKYRKKERDIESIINNNEMNMFNYSFKVERKDVDKVISDKCNVYISDNKGIKSEFEKHKKELKKEIVNQNQAIDKVINYINPIFVGDYILDKPISLMFIGKSGVGKSLLIDKLKDKIFNDNYIKVDLMEFKNDESIYKIVGSLPGFVGYKDKKNIFESLKDNCVSLVVFENYECASIKVKELIKNIIENGYFIDSSNCKISFLNSLIIITSNKKIKGNIGFTKDNILYDTFGLNKLVTDTIFFNNLDYDDIVKIINMKKVKVSLEEIIDKSDYKEVGAKNIEYLLSKRKVLIK